MATWMSLVDYVKARYEIDDEQDDYLQLVLKTVGHRSQAVVLRRIGMFDADEEWVRIDSIVGLMDDVDPIGVLRRVGGMPSGGIVIVDDAVVLRLAIPLRSLGLSEFERPFQLVVQTADRLEQEFSGRDRH